MRIVILFLVLIITAPILTAEPRNEWQTCLSIGPFLAEEPLTFEFKRKSGPAKGRKEAFDVGTQAYYLHVEDVARFEVKAVTPDAQKRAFVLKITGMLDKPEGPLTLYVPDKAARTRNSSCTTSCLTRSFFASNARAA